MPTDPLRFPYRDELLLPVIGLEAEFRVYIDGVEVVPEDIWGRPSAFITRLSRFSPKLWSRSVRKARR